MCVGRGRTGSATLKKKTYFTERTTPLFFLNKKINLIFFKLVPLNEVAKNPRTCGL